MSYEYDVFVCFIAASISSICMETWMSGQDRSNGVSRRGFWATENCRDTETKKKGRNSLAPNISFQKITNYSMMCVCLWMFHWRNGRFASSDTTRWWEFKRKVYMTCRIIQYRNNLMDSRVLCWRLLPWLSVMGKQTGCVLMVTDKANGNPRKLALSFLPLKASVIQGPKPLLGWRQKLVLTGDWPPDIY